MDYQALLAGMRRFGAGERDVCSYGIGVEPQQVRENVVIAPSWEPDALPGLGEARYLSRSQRAPVKVWDIQNGDVAMTYIKTGIGAPVFADALLPLGVTHCKRAIFIGSVGSLDRGIAIGDLVVPQYAVCGDGVSRYLAADTLAGGDVFGEKAYPDAALYEQLCASAAAWCGANAIGFHTARVFSTDTIFAQFAHIDEIMALGCNVIDMETAAAFRAAAAAGIQLAALYNVSDSTLESKSLVSGRTQEEKEHRRFTKRTAVPPILLDTFRALQRS